MRLQSYIAGLLLLLAGTVYAEQFANPLDVRLADPQVLLDNGTYYLYPTIQAGGYHVWTSQDLVNWRDQGVAFRTSNATWGQNRFWAPEVIKHNGKYYMFYSAGGPPNDTMRICVASATSPLGPFTDLAAPLFDDGKAYIDAHCFIDTDGQAYLYCSQDMSVPADGVSEIVVARLNSTFTGLASPIYRCIAPTASWEIASGGARWNEAPFVIKRGGYYYLLYSGNLYASSNYAIGYATATTPLGPWTKNATNPIVKKTSAVSGPGHCAVTQSPDGTELWLVYHTHQQASGGGSRQLAIDKIVFTPQTSGRDLLTVPGAPSTTEKSAPSGAPAFPAGGTDEFSATFLNRSRWTVFNENTANHQFNGSSALITTVDGDTYGTAEADQQNIFLQYPPYADFQVTTKVNFQPAQNYEQASLFVWQDHNNFIRFSNASIGGGLRFEIGYESAGVFTPQQVTHNYGADFWLRIRKFGNQYTCFASPNGSAWNQIGIPVNAAFIDRKIGFGAAAPDSGRRLTAAFDYFRVESLDSSVNNWTLY